MRWAYIREIWDFGSTMEIEEKHTGRYGARGQEREEKKKATPEEIAKQNQWRRERDVRRLIKWNFSSGDYWMTLTYKKGERPAWEQMKKDLAKLIRKVRLKYKKKGWELKYIYRLAIGKKGGPHVHLLVNREADQETGTDRIISELWENGHVYFASLYDAGGYVKLSEYMFELGYCEINANCVYEDGWKPIHATVLYNEMKRLADYILENNMDFENDYYCSLFEEEFFHPKLSSDLENWCGGNGVMLAVDPAGIIYPCLRYMESSLGNQQEPYSIGDVDHGICQTECDRCRVERLKKIDRRTQSTDECFNCPIAEGCSWCTAYNYQIFGTPDARATYICIMHKARALANAYFWNRYYKKNKINKRMKLYIPKEWALNIITEKEWNLLKREAEEG